MALTSKDLITTILAALTAGLYYAKVNEINLPLISSGYRLPILALAIIGIVMCASSGGGNPAGNMTGMTLVLSIAGVACFLIIIYGLITGAKIAFVILTAIILGMWLITTIKHAIGA